MIEAFVLIEAEADRIADLGEELAAIEGVAAAYSMAGSGVDLIAMLRVSTHEEIADVVTKEISRLDGIRSTQTLISFHQYSKADVSAAYDGFGD